MNIYKLQLLVSINGEGEQFKDLYFDMNTVTGFYIPTKQEDIEEEGEAVNLLFNGGQITVKQEEHLLNFLTNKFVNTAKYARTE